MYKRYVYIMGVIVQPFLANRWWRPFAALFVAAAAVAAVYASPVSAKTPTGTVTLVHGLPGVVADVSVDSRLLLSRFAPQRISDTITLAAGEHLFEVRPTGASQSSPPAVAATVTVADGARLSVAVGLNPAGKPAAYVFNDAPTWAADESVIAARYVATGSPARVLVDGTALGEALTSGNQQRRVVPDGTHALAVSSETDKRELLRQDVPVMPRAATVLYVTGTVAEGKIVMMAQTLSNLAGPVTPERVDTGTSGLAAAEPAPVVGFILLGSAVAMAAGLSTHWWWRRRSRDARGGLRSGAR